MKIDMETPERQHGLDLALLRLERKKRGGDLTKNEDAALHILRRIRNGQEVNDDKARAFLAGVLVGRATERSKHRRACASILQARSEDE